MTEYTNERLGFLAETYDGPRIVKDLAAALLAERKAREVEVWELRATIKSFTDCVVFNEHLEDSTFSMPAFRDAYRQALKGQRDE
jgi:hypothetical protein